MKKVYILLFVNLFLLLSLVSSSNVFNGTVSYWKLDETSGTTLSDSAGNNDLTTHNSPTLGVNGKIYNAVDFEKDNNQYATASDDNSLDITNQVTINAWVKFESSGGVILRKGGSTYDLSSRADNNKVQCNIVIGGSGHNLQSSSSVNFGVWEMWTMTYNGSVMRLYRNGVLDTSLSVSGNIDTDNNPLGIAGTYSGAANLDAVLDEVGLWNRSLNESEINNLYNSGSGLTYSSNDLPPVIILNSPENNYLSTSSNVTFNCSASDDYKVDNVSLLINDAINITNSSGVNNSDYLFKVNLEDNNYNWSCITCDNNSQCVKSEIRYFTVMSRKWIKSLNNNLLAYYKLDRSSGDVIDELGINNGTNNGATRNVAGKINKSFEFYNNYVSIPGTSTFSMKNKFTISAWVYSSQFDSPGWQEFISRGKGTTSNKRVFVFRPWAYTGQFNFQFFLDNGTNVGLKSPQSLTNNEWYFVVATYNSSNLSIYVDGELVNSTKTNYTINQIGGNIEFGRLATDSEYFKGKLDEVGFWNRSLSESEVNYLYNNGVGVTYTKLPNSPPNQPIVNSPLNNSVNNTKNTILNITILDDDNNILNNVKFINYNTSNIICEVSNNLYNNTDVTCNYTNLSSFVDYYWFVNVSDGVNVTTSYIYKFTTGDFNIPNISELSWITTGGFSSNELSYLQTIKNITVKIIDDSNINGYITIYKPSKMKVVNNISLSEYKLNYYNYSSNILLDEVGNWSVNITAVDEYNNYNNISAIIEVTVNQQSIRDGWYGYSKNKILNNSEIIDLSIYDYDIFELEDNSSNIDSNWETLKNSINNSKTQNIKVGINYLLNFNYNNSDELNKVLNNISLHFSDLTIPPYSSTVSYISLELINISNYNTTTLTNILNIISKNISVETQNKFVIFSKNYNNSNLDNSYIQYTNLIYLSPQTKSDFINLQKYYFNNSESLNRIYFNINNNTLRNYIKEYHKEIFDRLRSIPRNNLSNNYYINLLNGDVLVFNNDSVSKNISVSLNYVNGKDVWNFNEKYIIENNSDGNFNVEVQPYNTTIIYFENINKIFLTNNNTGVVYKKSTSSKRNFNYTDGVLDGNWGMGGAYDMQIELFDPHFIRNNFIVYYGWLNSSGITSPKGWEDYDIVILADKNNYELDRLNYSATEFYGYISVADYNNSNGWVESKKNEVDDWLNLNDSLNIFVDGLDYGSSTENFTNRMKELVDYIQIDKGRKAILNTYTYYEQFATWGKGGVMKESCVNRWNGNSAANPDSYSRENWSLELEKAVWYKNHNIRVLCQSFNNRTTVDNSQTITNYTDLLNIYFASKVLGYDYFYLSQPDFNYAHTIYVYDVGVDLDRSYHQLPSDSNVYYRTYEKGIIYYNTTSGQGWIDDGRIINNAQVCFYLYDAYPNNYVWSFDVNHRNREGSIGEYEIPDSEMTLYDWKWVCKNISEDTYAGRYLIEGWVDAHTTIVGQGFNLGNSVVANSGRHSWWDTSPSDTFYIYTGDRNWMVNLEINETKQTSLDTTNKIQQVEEIKNNIYYINLTSNKHFPKTVISNIIIINTTQFKNVSAKDVDGNWIVLNLINTTTCDTTNPIFNYTNINNSIYGVCFTQRNNQTIYRFSVSSLSTREFKIDYSTETNIIYCYNCSDCNNKIIEYNNTNNIILLNESIINNVGVCIKVYNIKNVTFDGGNYLIDGTGGGYGIYLKDSDYVNLVNCNVTNFNGGIYLERSDNNYLYNITSKTNSNFNIKLYQSKYNYINNTNTRYAYYGLMLQNSYNNIINNSVYIDSKYDDLYVSAGSDMECNNLVDNIYSSGDRTIEYYNYSVNLNDKSFSELILCNADNSNLTNIFINGSTLYNNNRLYVNRVENMRLINFTSIDNYCGIYGYAVDNSYFKNLNIRNAVNGYSVYMRYSDYNNFYDIISDNNKYGFTLSISHYNNIYNLTSNNNVNEGIWLYGSSHNIIHNFTSINNTWGLMMSSNSNYNNVKNGLIYNNYQRGVYLWGSSYGILVNNSIINNSIGIDLYQNTHNNIINDSYIKYNDNGIKLTYYSTYNPYNNLIYNNYLNNSVNIIVDNNINIINYFNTSLRDNVSIINTTHIGGNFWSNLNNTGYSDLCADVEAPYGICDEYYNISGFNIDYLPLTLRKVGISPLIHIINPTGEDEHSDEVLFKIETNRVSSCVLNLGDNINYSMNSDNSLVFYLYKTLESDRYYTATFYCNTTSLNSTNYSSVSFYYRNYQEHSWTGNNGGGGASTSQVIIYETGDINVYNLSDLDLKLRGLPLTFDKEFSLIITPLDNDSNVVDVDEINISLNTNNYTGFELVKMLDGSYKKKFIIPQQNISRVVINVTARQGNRIVGKIIYSDIYNESIKTKFTGLVFSSIDFTKDNWSSILFFIILILIMFFMLMLIKILNNKNV